MPIKAEVYYFSGVNLGVGHIAVKVKDECSGSTKEIYITVGGFIYIDENDKAMQNEFYRTEDGGYDSPVDSVDYEPWKYLIADDDYFDYFDHDVSFYNSANIFKATIESDMTYDDFLIKLADKAKKNIDEKYNIVRRNCAHMTNKVLNIICGDERAPLKDEKFGLLPITEFKSAIKLSKEKPKKITRYDFAESMLATSLKQIECCLRYELYTTRVNEFINLKNDFITSVRYNKNNPSKIGQEFAKLSTFIQEIENTIGGNGSKFFKALKHAFYGFTRIFCNNPELEASRSLLKNLHIIEKNEKTIIEEENKQKQNSPKL